MIRWAKVFSGGLILFSLLNGVIFADAILDLSGANTVIFHTAKGQPAIDVRKSDIVHIIIGAVPQFHYDSDDKTPVAICCRPGTVIECVGDGGIFKGDIIAIDDQGRPCAVDELIVSGNYALNGTIYVNKITRNGGGNFWGSAVFEGKSPPQLFREDRANLPLLENLMGDSILKHLVSQILELGSDPYHQQSHDRRLLCQTLGGINRSQKLAQWQRRSLLGGVMLGFRQWIAKTALSCSLHGGWLRGKSYFRQRNETLFSTAENHGILAADLRYDGFHGLFHIYGTADYFRRRYFEMMENNSPMDGFGCRTGALLGFRQILFSGKSGLNPLVAMLKSGGGYQIQRHRQHHFSEGNFIFRDGTSFSLKPLNSHFPFCHLLGSLEQLIPLKNSYLFCRLEMDWEHRFSRQNGDGRETILTLSERERFLQKNAVSGSISLTWRGSKGWAVAVSSEGNFSSAMQECWFRAMIFREF